MCMCVSRSVQSQCLLSLLSSFCVPLMVGVEHASLAQAMGMTLQEFYDAGMAAPTGGPGTSSTGSWSFSANRPDPQGPRSKGQENYMNDLGILPSQWPETYAEASSMINEHKMAEELFKATHDGKKPATGRQKEALRSKSIEFDEDLTKETATSLLDSAVQTTYDEPITESQAKWLTKHKIAEDKMPKTKAEAISFIGNTISQISTASDRQKALLQNLNPSINGNILNCLTKHQAAIMIENYIKNKRKSGSSSCKTSPHSPTDPHDDGDGDEGSHRCASTSEGGVYGQCAGRRSSQVVLNKTPLSGGSGVQRSFACLLAFTLAKVVKWHRVSYPSLI
ncbi:hypothetical protein Vafri_13419 [Volvox africanus]|nr:hypothetical protein Vafri_13419 [Volvox africanus]